MSPKRAKILNRCSCEPKSTYPPSVLSLELQIALERFLDILWRVNPHRRESWASVGNRSDYAYTIHRKYAEIFCGAIRTFKISRGGLIYGWKARSGPFGDIFEIVAARARGRKISWDGNQSITIRGKECSGCGGTKFVMQTVVGPRCKSCRGVLTRHANAVRQLGGMPTAYGRPVVNIIEGGRQ